MTVSAAVAVIAFVGGFIWMMEARWPLNPAKFSKHRQDLKVIEADIKRARKTPEKWIENLGTNRFERKWTTYELEIRFLDQDGQLIDKQLPPVGYPIYTGPSFWLTGFITNSGKYAWNVRKFEARFFDQSSNLVNVETLYKTFFVAPRSQTAFRLEMSELPTQNTNLVVKVRIQDAEDGNSREN